MTHSYKGLPSLIFNLLPPPFVRAQYLLVFLPFAGPPRSLVLIMALTINMRPMSKIDCWAHWTKAYVTR
jgi:hypothetical protein